MGARCIQTSFIYSLMKKRKEDNLHSVPILIIDNTFVGAMAAESLKNQNVYNVNINDNPNSWPHHPSLLKNEQGFVEHPIWIKSWRDLYKTDQKGLHDVIDNNWERCYSIDYSFTLNKMIHLHKLKNEKQSFIGYHYGKLMGLEYYGNTPMLKVNNYNKELEMYINGLSKPYILMHLGVDLNDHDMLNPVNYRFFKTWSLFRWSQIVEKLKHKYEFIQVSNGKWNPDIPGIKSIKVNDFNSVLQLLENKKCAFFMSIDNYLHHLAASIKKPGLVIWTSVSPNVWGWKKEYQDVPHFHISNVHSCPQIYCWRPGIGDVDANSRNWICPNEYKCGESVTVDQVSREIEKVENYIKTNKNPNKIEF